MFGTAYPLWNRFVLAMVHLVVVTPFLCVAGALAIAGFWGLAAIRAAEPHAAQVVLIVPLALLVVSLVWLTVLIAAELVRRVVMAARGEE